MQPISAFPDDAKPCRHPPADECITLIAATGAMPQDAAGHRAVLWLVLRGRVEVRAREGEFSLCPRDWIALESDSVPHAISGSDALLLGIGIGGVADPQLAPSLRMMAGRGRMARGMRGRAVRLWHALGAQVATEGCPIDADRAAAVSEFVDALQAELIDVVDRCPGHSDRRKLQILHRMQ